MLRDLYADCLTALDASSLSVEDRALWASVLMRNPAIVQAYFLRMFRAAPELLLDATTELRLSMHAADDPAAMEALLAHERRVIARA